jgi:hypothetical protein
MRLEVVREGLGRRLRCTERGIEMGKYVIAWLLGVPLTLLVVIYVVSHAACGS